MTYDGSIPPRDAVEAYASNRIAGASPAQLILMAYDYTIGCCRRGDAINAKRGLVELQSSLNLDYLDVAAPLYRLYEYCGESLRAGDFDTTMTLLTELRDAWNEAAPRGEAELRTARRGDVEA